MSFETVSGYVFTVIAIAITHFLTKKRSQDASNKAAAENAKQINAIQTNDLTHITKDIDELKDGQAKLGDEIGEVRESVARIEGRLNGK